MSKTQLAHISSTFIWRRVHSLMGFWLVIYLTEHLIVNSQAALWLGDDGIGFIKFANFLESLPYLQIIESLLIGLPLLIHAIWGIKRALEAKRNSSKSNGSSPSLPYGRNKAFTWQRLSSWILLIGICGHVIQMRFVDYPQKIEIDNEIKFLSKISFDEGLYTLAPRLNTSLHSKEMIEAMHCTAQNTFSQNKAKIQNQIQTTEQYNTWVKKLKSFSLQENEVIAESPSPGVAMLLMIRNTFKNPWMAICYTIFVLAAAFHAFNGFWTFLITWGLILSYRSQKSMLPISMIGMAILSLLGIVAIWGSYWINLRS